MIPKPSTSVLKIVMTDAGRMEFRYNGKPLPGVIHIETNQEKRDRAVIKVSFIGCAVGFETEPAAT